MLFLDFLLLLMITICVGYCWILNNRIRHLQNSRIEFARMIKELNVSIVKAESNVKEMSSLSKIASTEIKAAIDDARSATSELTELNSQAEHNSKILSQQLKDFDESFDVEDHSYDNVISARSGEKFSENDFAQGTQNDSPTSYTNHLKNFIQNIVTKDPENVQNLNQANYYNTLRKINAKK